MEKEYYIIYNGRQEGPMPLRELVNYGLTPHSQVWCQGMDQWMEAYMVPEVMGLINSQGGGYSATGGSVPPAPPAPDPIQISTSENPHYQQHGPRNQYNYQHQNSVSDKSNVAFGLLAIFLGGLGVQYFYVGKTTGGLICLLLSVVSCGLWNIINFIQGILAICMSQSEFERKFVYSDSSFPIF